MAWMLNSKAVTICLQKSIQLIFQIKHDFVMVPQKNGTNTDNVCYIVLQ